MNLSVGLKGVGMKITDILNVISCCLYLFKLILSLLEAN